MIDLLILSLTDEAADELGLREVRDRLREQLAEQAGDE